MSESSVCRLVRSKKPLNNIPGGKAQGMSPSDFNPKLLKKGIKIEREHTPSKKKALEITMDHTKEFRGYYKDKNLPALERKLERQKVASLNDLYIYKYGAFLGLGAMPGLAKAKGMIGNIGRSIKRSVVPVKTNPVVQPHLSELNPATITDPRQRSILQGFQKEYAKLRQAPISGEGSRLMRVQMERPVY